MDISNPTKSKIADTKNANCIPLALELAVTVARLVSSLRAVILG